MNILTIEINAISELALQIMQAVLAKNKEVQKFTDEEDPLLLASGLSDFFELAALLESGKSSLDSNQLAEFGGYALSLVDRLAYLARQLGLMDMLDALARVYASLAVWLARRNAVLDNLEGIADGFARIVNSSSETDELAEMCQLMEEVAVMAAQMQDIDKTDSDAWRPWRVLNLNIGIAASRSLDPQLMEQTFERISFRLPSEMPNFFAHGKRQMDLQDVSEPAREMMNRYAEKWPKMPFH